MGKIYVCWKGTKFITKLLKNSSVNVSYTTHNTIGKLLSLQSNTNQNKFDGSGVYQLTCPDCKMKYVGQTEGHSIQDFTNISGILNTPIVNQISRSIF